MNEFINVSQAVFPHARDGILFFLIAAVIVYKAGGRPKISFMLGLYFLGIARMMSLSNSWKILILGLGLGTYSIIVNLMEEEAEEN